MSKTRIPLPLPPLEVLEEWFSYDPDSGELRWRKSPVKGWGLGGQLAGNIEAQGYRKVSFLGKQYKAHRIVFKLATGLEPPPELDHRNGRRDDNRLGNIRVPGGRCDNVANATISRNNTSGHVGVGWHVSSRLWVGFICQGGRQVSASFLTKEEAVAWRIQKEVELHGEFSQHRRNGTLPMLPGVERRTTRRDNTSGVNGVAWSEKQRHWRARITVKGRKLSKVFPTKEEAITQRRAWEAEFKAITKPEAAA